MTLKTGFDRRGHCIARHGRGKERCGTRLGGSFRTFNTAEGNENKEKDGDNHRDGSPSGIEQAHGFRGVLVQPVRPADKDDHCRRGRHYCRSELSDYLPLG